MKAVVELNVAFIGEIERKGPVAHVLLVYVHEQVQIIKEQAPQIRRGTLDSVHLMRIAIRRLRSVLATYRTLLDAELVIHLREELKWLGLILGSQRDAEVMGQRIKKMIATEPFKLTLAPISRWIDEQLESDFHIARLAVLKTLDDKRYLQLLKDLDALLAAPPLTDLASEPVKMFLPDLIKNDWKRLRQDVRTSQNNSVGHETSLHEVRKSAKRLRYAAETATLVHYKQAEKLAEAAEEIQTILGEHHDCVLSRELLHRLDEQAHARGEQNFNCERLDALEERNAVHSENQLRKAWKHFPQGSLKG